MPFRLFPLIAAALVAVGAASAAAPPPNQQTQRVPDETWLRYEDVREAGFDTDALQAAHEAWQELPSSAFLVVSGGAVVAAWGDVERRFRCHSVRKSLLSALFGVYHDRGAIELNKTLADLGIDDYPAPLLESERQARILDLLKARSGVFHPAAYAGRTDSRPRGSEGPGRYFAYNNWDFNTLAAILTQETGADVFEAFDEHFGRPLGMQDWRVADGYYHYERDKSRFPAYPFRMSARDLARFGLLFAREGVWGERRILSQNWVRRSTAEYSIDSSVFGYGFMWWVLREPRFRRVGGGFAASGVGNQKVLVLPELDLVIVNRANTYDGERTPGAALLDLVEQVVEARTSEPAAEPRLAPLPDTPAPGATNAPAEALREFLGEWPSPPPQLGLPARATASLALNRGHLTLRDPYARTFRAFLQPDGTLLVEDSLRRLIALRDDRGVLVGLADNQDLVRAAVRAAARGETASARQLLASTVALAAPRSVTADLLLRMIAAEGPDEVAELIEAVGVAVEAHGLGPVAQSLDGASRDLMENGHAATAIRIFEVLCGAFPRKSGAWTGLGEAREAEGDRAGAVRAYVRAVFLSPNNRSARAGLERLRE